jgi:hypothetical protein
MVGMTGELFRVKPLFGKTLLLGHCRRARSGAARATFQPLLGMRDRAPVGRIEPSNRPPPQTADVRQAAEVRPGNKACM